MRLFILGANGRTGTELVDLALKQGHQVTAFVRSPEKLAIVDTRLHVIKGSLGDVEGMRTPRKPDAAPETRRRARVASPAKALPMAPVALCPERIKTLRHLARTCPPSRRAHQVLPSWVVHAARR
jgi:uncharacterized protein YbjT (DUF2867 family)